jgi:hypothetical protein
MSGVKTKLSAINNSASLRKIGEINRAIIMAMLLSAL